MTCTIRRLSGTGRITWKMTTKMEVATPTTKNPLVSLFFIHHQTPQRRDIGLYVLRCQPLVSLECSGYNKSKLLVCCNECRNTHSPEMPPTAICLPGEELDRSRISSLTHPGGYCTATSSPLSISSADPDNN